MNFGELKEQAQLKWATLWQDTLAPRYQSLSESERRILNIATIALPLIVLIFGVVLPMLDTNKALRAEIQSLATKVARANQLADLLARQPRQTKADDTNILSAVDKLARQAAVRSFMTRLRPQQLPDGKQRLQTQLKQVPYSRFADFIAQLEQQGYSVSRLKMQAAGDGMIHAQITIGR